MATVIGKTSLKIDQLLGDLIIKVELVDGHLLVTTRDGAVTDVGLVGGEGGGTITISDVVDLTNQLAGKSPVGHTHTKAQITDLALHEGVRLLNPAGLSSFYAAVAKRKTRPARVVFFGSSTTAGFNATAASNRYVNRLITEMQASYPSGGTETAVMTYSAGVGNPPPAPGIQGFNGGISGRNSSNYAQDNVQYLGFLNADLVVHMIGSNDSVIPILPADYKANIESIIDAAADRRSHLLIHTYRRYASGVTPATWALYGQALAEIAQSRPNVAFLDLSGFYEDQLVLSDPLNLIDTDDVHMTDAGHELMAQLIARALGVPVLSDALAGSGGSAHTHDDIYYTEAEIDAALAGKAPLDHTHFMANITGLSAALDAKADDVHTHTKAQITDLAEATEATAGLVQLATLAEATTGIDTSRAMTAAGVKAAINAVVDAAPGALDTLNELAAALGDDPNFATTMTNALAGKASTSHLHDDRYYTETEIDNTLTTYATQNDLAGGLANKAHVSHTHTTAQVTGLDTALANKAPLDHTHFMANITGLSAALDAKMDAGPMDVLTLSEQAVSPATPANSEAFLYTKADGGLYLKSDLGIERSLLTADSALHLNADFELGSSVVPQDWTNYWGQTGTWSYDTTTAIQGVRSVKNDSTGLGSGNVRLGTNVFPVAGESTIEVTFWSKTDVAANVTITFMSSPTSGNPDYFGAETTQQSSAHSAGTSWAKYTSTFTIPAGHTKARFYFIFTVGRQWWLDATGSRVSAPAPTPFGVITGEIKLWPTATAPTGYLLCNGGSFSSDTYPVLAALLGDTFGVHSGTTYYLPDFRGRSPLGVGTASPAVAGGTTHTLGQKGGEEKHTQTLSELAAHTHQQTLGGAITTVAPSAGSGVIGQSNTSLTTSAGSSTPFNVLDPFLGINFIIKAG